MQSLFNREGVKEDIEVDSDGFEVGGPATPSCGSFLVCSSCGQLCLDRECHSSKVSRKDISYDTVISSIDTE